MTATQTDRISPWRALGPLFFSRTRYVDLALSHALALCLENAQYQVQYAQGAFPNQAWESKARQNLGPAADKLARSFGASFLATAGFFLAAIVLALLLGRVAPERPLDISKALGFLGAFLAGWATLFELGGYVETIGGEQLHELLHPVLFRIAFLPGLAIAAISQVW